MPLASFRAVGFCGADDSVHPNLLGIFSQAYPLVEFGVLFRPDKTGQPRYPTLEWVERLSQVAKRSHNPLMKLAAHLCGSHVNDVLLHHDPHDFLLQLQDWGFQRVQINATAVNGVDTSKLAESVPGFLSIIEKYPSLEFIIQKNDETAALWQGLLPALESEDGPKNVVMLEDESKGTGVAAKSWPYQPRENNHAVSVGFAGGIGPHNIRQVLSDVQEAAAPNQRIWVDMESSLRSIKNGQDIFDLEKCYQVIDVSCDVGIMRHPSYLAQDE